MMNFADRLIDAIRKKKSCVCVGLDPRLDLIPQEIVHQYDIFDYDINIQAGYVIRDFCNAVIDAVADDAVAVKPQSAFFEQYGWPGVQALEQIVNYAQQKGLLVILDVKRSDIASTAEAYAKAFFKGRDISADAITVNPYLGMDSLEPFIKLCTDEGKGLFVLVKTSNPGSKDFQDALLQDNRKLYELVAEKVGQAGQKLVGKEGYSSIGAVVGATFPQEAETIRKLMPKTIFLVPGYGAQGAKAEDLKDYFNTDGLGVIINASRSIIFAGAKSTNWQGEIKKAAKEMKEEIGRVTRKA
ncbi:MAG: orotidine-5'-phosphate decarboxylase [Planctomycetota bacterium]